MRYSSLGYKFKLNFELQFQINQVLLYKQRLFPTNHFMLFSLEIMQKLVEEKQIKSPILGHAWLKTLLTA
jgi:hypothetical protein